MRQLAAFGQMCAASTLLALDEEVARRAAAIYAELHDRSALIGDADMRIAGTALVHGLALAYEQ